MLNFVIIIFIILEIIFTFLSVKYLILLNSRVLVYDELIKKISDEIIEENRIIRNILKNINKITGFFKNEKIIRIRQIIRFFIETIQIILILKTFDFKKGLKFNFKNVKKLVYAQVFKEFLRKILNNFQACFH